MKKEVIAYVHSHWDREWYREYEVFRMRLLKVFDNVLDMLENNKIPSFYFDGQTSALTDYLEIRPEKEEQVKRFIKEKKLFIGPFYCLVDEFLTDTNCFRKNIEIGLKTAKDFGCEDFVAYFADTFGHSASVIPILKEYGINTAVVWRGCPDLPSEFDWKFKSEKINTINLVRGYFNDIFSATLNIEKKAEFLKHNLDLISEKSGDVLLLPIGADHLGVEKDLKEQIQEVNKYLEDYEIKLGSIFEYIDLVKQRFNDRDFDGELRDNSKTFILEGCYSSRADIKYYNTKCSHELKKSESLVKYFKLENNYKNLIEYAYKLLLQNQAHDSICGCSTDDVHSENVTRYKKIIQITNTILEDIRALNEYKLDKIVNLFDSEYSGYVSFLSEKEYPKAYQKKSVKKGFPPEILSNTSKIPITEDYTDIYEYVFIQDKPVKSGEMVEIKPSDTESDVFVTDKCIGNSKIFLSIENNQIKIGDKPIKFLDFTDNGDSYNTGYQEGDNGIEGEIISSKVLASGGVFATLGIEIKLNDEILKLEVSLSKYSSQLDFDIRWENKKTNHLLEFVIDTNKNIVETYSEDFDNIIIRPWEPEYNVRQHLPKEKGKEVKSNNAPMRRGVMANEVGIVTYGLNQYEVFKTELRIPILRATGQISNPNNPSRTTPAGPPIEVKCLQMNGENRALFSVFSGTDLKKEICYKFNGCVVI